MGFKRLRRTYGCVGHIFLGAGLGFGCFDAPLDLANVVEIAFNAGAIGRREALLKSGGLLAYRIENTAVLSLSSEALLGGAAVAKQFLKDHLGAVFHG